MSKANAALFSMDRELAVSVARAIERDPSLFERQVDLVQSASVHPEAREVLQRVFRTRRKVAFRYQRARPVVMSPRFA